MKSFKKILKESSKQTLNESRCKQVLNESWQYLTEQERHDIVLFENELSPLFRQLQVLLEADLTPQQIEVLFGTAEQVTGGKPAKQGFLSKVWSAIKLPAKVISAINKKMDDFFYKKIQTLKPVEKFDAAFDDAKNKIAAKFGPNSPVTKAVEAYRAFGKKHPVAQSLIIGTLIALLSLAVGPAAAAIAGLVFKMFNEVLKGEKLSTAIYKGGKAAAISWLAGWGIRKLADFFSHIAVTTAAPPVDAALLPQGSVSCDIIIDSNDPEILKAVHGVFGSEVKAIHFFGSQEYAQQLSTSLKDVTKQLTEAVASGNVERVTELATTVNTIAQQAQEQGAQWIANIGQFAQSTPLGQIQPDTVVEGARQLLNASVTDGTQAAAASSFLDYVGSHGANAEQAQEAAKQIANAANLHKVIGRLGKVVAAVAQGLIQKSGSAKPEEAPKPEPTQEDLPAQPEGQQEESAQPEFKLEGKIPTFKEFCNEGFFDDVKAAWNKGREKAGYKPPQAQQAAEPAQTGKPAEQGQQAQKPWPGPPQQPQQKAVTAQQLRDLWKKAGSPKDHESIKKIMKQAGLNDQQIKSVFEGGQQQQKPQQEETKPPLVPGGGAEAPQQEQPTA